MIHKILKKNVGKWVKKKNKKMSEKKLKKIKNVGKWVKKNKKILLENVLKRIF